MVGNKRLSLVSARLPRIMAMTMRASSVLIQMLPRVSQSLQKQTALHKIDVIRVLVQVQVPVTPRCCKKQSGMHRSGAVDSRHLQWGLQRSCRSHKQS